MSWVGALLLSAYAIGFVRYSFVIFEYSREVRKQPVADWSVFHWVALVAAASLWPLVWIISAVTWCIRRLTT